MKHAERQIEEARQELERILSGNDPTGAQVQKLKELALRIGASMTKLYPGYGDASVPELVHNIHQALQTKSTVAALQTSRTYLTVSIILALIAFFSMLAAWVGVLKRQQPCMNCTTSNAAQATSECANNGVMMNFSCPWAGCRVVEE